MADAAEAAARPSPVARDRNPLPGPPKQKWETAGAPDEPPAPQDLASAKTKRIAR
jgi:hypothetical protein